VCTSLGYEDVWTHANSGNVVFDGTRENEDFGLEPITGEPSHMYAFRSAPLRNVALEPAFFHDGAFTDLEEAIRHHLDPSGSARSYDAVAAGVDDDLTHRLGPVDAMIDGLDPQLASPPELSETEPRLVSSTTFTASSKSSSFAFAAVPVTTSFHCPNRSERARHAGETEYNDRSASGA